MDISIIIVNWNVEALLERCLQSIYRLTQGINFEVFVVDNNSSDNSQEMIRTEFPQVNLITNQENLGFAKANNQAIEKSSGRYVLLLNPDAELIDNSLKIMVEFIDIHPQVDALGCKLIYPDGSLQYSCRHFPSLFTDLMGSLYLDALFPKSKFFNYYKMGCWEHNFMQRVDQPYGACLLFRQETLKRVGLLDERFFMYYEEVDLCYRIKKNEGEIYFLPQIKIVHYANQSSKQISFECEHWKCKSRLLFFEKHYGRWSIWVLTFNLAMSSMLAWGLFPLLHLLFGRPRDVSYFKEPLRIMWSEYNKFF